MNVFIAIMLIGVGCSFVTGPADLLNNMAPVSKLFWIVVIVFLLWAAWKICDKIPATKPYTAVIRGILKIGKFF